METEIDLKSISRKGLWVRLPPALPCAHKGAESKKSKKEDTFTMAHEIARSVRTGLVRMGSTQKEWHHGDTDHTVWSGSPTCEQVITDLDFDTEIQVRPIYDEDRMPIAELRETWRGHFYPTGEKVLDEGGRHKGTRLGLVGPSYQVCQDSDFVKWFQPWIDADMVELQSFGAIYGGSRVFGLAKIKRDPIDILPDDACASYIGIINGHDMKIGFFVLPTNVRIVCANTVAAAMASKEFKKLGFKHVGDVAKKMSDIRDAAKSLDGMFLKECEKFQALAHGEVPNGAVLKVFFQKMLGTKVDDFEDTAAAPSHDDSRNVLPKLMELYEKGIGNKGKTWWDAYNAWTQFTTSIRGRTADVKLEKMYTGTTAAQNALALGFGLAALRGDDISTMTGKEAKRLALAA